MTMLLVDDEPLALARLQTGVRDLPGIVIAMVITASVQGVGKPGKGLLAMALGPGRAVPVGPGSARAAFATPGARRPGPFRAPAPGLQASGWSNPSRPTPAVS